jgi:hypothetical protein
MRSVVVVGPGELELNYMWLPTWIGMNTALKAEIETALQPKLVGQPLDNDTLDWAHEQVVLILEGKFPELTGLRDFLDSLKFID